MWGNTIICIMVIAIGLFLQNCEESSKWYKGNLHTHSYWSDGDDYPEMIINWYKQNGYDFIALSDHNILSKGEKWIDAAYRRGGMAAYQKYLDKYGSDWVNQKTIGDTLRVRLKTLQEFRGLFEEQGKFLIVQSEEISDGFEGKPVHINATNIQTLIPPQGGNSISDVMQNNVDAVFAQREKTGEPMIPHINHPNFGWAITAEDLIALKGERFFEVYNGHPAVRNDGDDLHPDTDRMWDIILAHKLTNGEPLLYGVAVDDAHNYHEIGVGESNTGRGWIMVKMPQLSAVSLIEAMENGDFYSSTGISIDEISFNGNSLAISIRQEEGVTYTTQFIGTLKEFERQSEAVEAGEGNYVTRKYSDQIGQVFAEVLGSNPVYTLSGEELYVRARIVSTKLQENPYREGKYEMAWSQPVRRQ